MTPRDAIHKRRDKIATYLEGRDQVTTVPLLKHLRLPNTKKHQAALRELLPLLGWERQGPRKQVWTPKKEQKSKRRSPARMLEDRRAILAAVRSGGVWTLKQLAAAIKNKPAQTWITLSRLVEDGKVLRIGNQGEGAGTVYVSAD